MLFSFVDSFMRSEKKSIVMILFFVAVECARLTICLSNDSWGLLSSALIHHHYIQLLINSFDHHISETTLPFCYLSVVIIVKYQKCKLEGLTIIVSMVLKSIGMLITKHNCCVFLQMMGTYRLSQAKWVPWGMTLQVFLHLLHMSYASFVNLVSFFYVPLDVMYYEFTTTLLKIEICIDAP